MKMGEARCRAQQKHPYTAHQLDYTLFKDYENLPDNHHSTRPGRKSGEPTVAEIRVLKYVNGEVFYKAIHIKEWEQHLQQRTKHKKVEPKQLYWQQLKIEQRKYESLQILKPFMLKEHQLF
jgi:hypothetical protein